MSFCEELFMLNVRACVSIFYEKQGFTDLCFT